jgi:aspartyl/asparaginyl beta-hydroxylase (cupin superfamily)
MTERFDEFCQFLSGQADWSQRLAPGQRLSRNEIYNFVAYFPGLSAVPYPAFRPPWLRRFDEKLGSIQQEVSNIQVFQPYEDGTNTKFGLANAHSWLSFEIVKPGTGVVPQAHSQTPVLAELFETIPADEIVNARLSVLEPHTELAPHHGPSNLWLLAHFGIIVPEGCTLTVDGITMPHREGEWIVFDDTFAHSARNGSNRRRIVLIISLPHPDLTKGERDRIRRMLLGS